jgi:hypothetical protein
MVLGAAGRSRVALLEEGDVALDPLPSGDSSIELGTPRDG